MYFNNRGNRQYYGSGCSIFGCILGFFLLISVIQGGLYLFFRYFWVIVLLAIVIWFFRQWTNRNATNNKDESGKQNDWHRDYENRENTSYHNIDREFEEVDEVDEEDEFEDF